MRTTPDSLRPNQSPLATSVARHSRPSVSPCCHRGLYGHPGSTGLSRDFRRRPVRSLSASRHPERWREPHYLAFDRLRRRSSAVYSVCILPLIHPGRISAPWLPTTYKPGSHCESPGSTCLSAAEVASRRERFTSRVLGSNEPLCQILER